MLHPMAIIVTINSNGSWPTIAPMMAMVDGWTHASWYNFAQFKLEFILTATIKVKAGKGYLGCDAFQRSQLKT